MGLNSSKGTSKQVSSSSGFHAIFTRRYETWDWVTKDIQTWRQIWSF